MIWLVLTRYFPLTVPIMLRYWQRLSNFSATDGHSSYAEGTPKYSGTKYFTIVLQALFIVYDIAQLELN